MTFILCFSHIHDHFIFRNKVTMQFNPSRAVGELATNSLVPEICICPASCRRGPHASQRLGCLPYSLVWVKWSRLSNICSQMSLGGFLVLLDLELVIEKMQSRKGSCPFYILHIFFSLQEVVAYGGPALDLETSWALLAVRAEEWGGPVASPDATPCPSLTSSQGPPGSLQTSVSLFTGLVLVSCLHGWFWCSLRLLRKLYIMTYLPRHLVRRPVKQGSSPFLCPGSLWLPGEVHGPLLRIMFLNVQNTKFTKETDYISMHYLTIRK